MNRRGFLGLLGAAAAGFALDPERLLWVPGQKTIFLPSVQRFAPVNLGAIVAAAWEEVVKERLTDRYDDYWLFQQLSEGADIKGDTFAVTIA